MIENLVLIVQVKFQKVTSVLVLLETEVSRGRAMVLGRFVAHLLDDRYMYVCCTSLNPSSSQRLLNFGFITLPNRVIIGFL